MLIRFLLYPARTLALFLPMLAAGPMAVAQAAAPPQTATAPAPEVHARGDISGDWQGTLQLGRSIQTVLKISKTDKGWAGKVFLIVPDQGSQSFDATTVTLDGSAFKFFVASMGFNYEGTLGGDGASIVGTVSGLGPGPQPFTVVRATKETAWEIPPPPPPPKLMAADADPSFDVATIKPNPSGAAQMQGLNVNGRNFTTRNSSLVDLISFAYDVQVKQIVGAPDWMDKDRYDIAAVPDQEGAPSVVQLKTMIKKLVADRFKLTFHRDKREMAAFVLTVGKGGQKLTPTQLTGPLPGLGFRPAPTGLTLSVRNGTLGDFTAFLQTLVLDRPVVDQTDLKGRFDFQFTFTPDDSQFNGHPPKLPPPADATTAPEPAPNLLDAIQQQIGLKLSSGKTPVEVIVVDHVEKPSPN